MLLDKVDKIIHLDAAEKDHLLVMTHLEDRRRSTGDDGKVCVCA